MAYLPWLAAAALALGIFSFWQSNRGPAVPVGSKIIYNNVDVSSKAASLYEGIKTNVASIKDANSAQASLPKLREAVTSLGEIRDLQEKMPADSRKGLATLFGTLVPGLEGLVGTALKAPGAEAVVKPVLDQVMERMKTLAKG